MKKRTKVRIISFLTAAALSAAGLCIYMKNENEVYRRQLGNVYMSSLNSLCESLGNISTELKKSTYVTTPEKLSLVAAEIYHESGLAMAALSQLPSGEEDLSPVYKFVSQAGDYSLSVSRGLIAGDGIANEQRENLKALADAAGKLSAGVEQMRIAFENGEGIKLEIEGDTTSGGVAQSLSEVGDSMTDYPTLIYDGPYSDHILTGESKMLASARELTLEEARTAAAKALSVSAEELSFSGEQEGTLPAYRFITEDTTIAVTKRGGYTLYFRKYREQGTAALSYEQAVEKARVWLSEHSNLTFKDSYYFADEGVCTVNFAYKEGATVCYTDLIKVGVALDTGEVVLCEADGFIMNHAPRTISTPVYSEEQARAVVSPALEIISSSRVLIPSDGKMEKACYEFHCTDSDGQEVLVYINYENLREERIFLVLSTDGGTLTK